MKAKAVLIPRRRSENLTRIHVVVPAHLDTAAREYAAATRQSLASLHAEALRSYLAAKGNENDQEARDAVLTRQLLRLSRKVDTLDMILRVVAETQGQQNVVLLGSLREPRSDKERSDAELQAERRITKMYGRVAESVRRPQGEFLAYFLKEIIARAQDFPTPPNHGAASASPDGEEIRTTKTA
jgi:hypothetical protein